VAAGDEAEPRPAAGFRDTVVLRGLREPLAVAFASDGRVFVGEKGGLVREFPRLGSRRSRVAWDLGERVFRNGDRGLFGLALDRRFPHRPYVYVLYTFDGPIAAKRPLGRRRCPELFSGGCPVSGRLSRLGPDGERVLLAGWCQQYPSHGVGSVVAGPDGLLYASGGEGASYDRVDTGDARNVCGDPRGEGGALRAQDARTPGDPLGVGGGVVAVQPETGAHRLVAHGLRNPFRLAFRPRSTELWIGDVGSTRADELNVVDVETPRPANFGWPCYEGNSPLRSYDEADVPLCERLYDEETVREPAAVFGREDSVVAGDPCGRGTQALSGLAFYEGGSYPSRYRGALFFADFARRCIWALLPGEDGRPDPERIELFRTGVAAPVALVTGPGGDLFYLDFTGGALHRLSYTR
jgi:glucose/arabinose dehydrogenase